jgi:hypothetical protein
MTNIRNSPSGRELDIAAPLLDYGRQPEWAVDEVAGRDYGSGTPSDPLQTVAELSARLSGVTIEQPTTVSYLGDVTDSLDLTPTTKFAVGASLTVSGVRTVRATGIAITVVTAIGAGTTYPWQLTTTGIDWTTVAATIGALPLRVDFSTGHIAWVTEVIDASNIIVSAVANTTAFVNPAAGQTLEIVTFSTSPLPLLQVFPQLLQSSVAIDFTNLAFTAGGFFQVLSGPSTRFFGCDISMAASASMFCNCVLAIRSCALRANGLNPVSGTNTFQLVGGVVQGGTGLIIRRGHMTTSSAMFQASQLFVGDTGFVRAQGLQFRSCASPLTVTTGGRFLNTNARLSGSNCTGVGVTISSGAGFSYIAGANGKPTLTGTSDVLIGAVARTYAQIPYVDLQLNAIPPTLTTLVGGGGYMVAE